MGRASRKGSSSASGREHWTETHPDRHLWSPGRLAQARMQTLEEYEALYGRGTSPAATTRSRIFPAGILIPSPITSAERQAILLQIDAPPGTTIEDFEQDTFIERLWQAELARIRQEAEIYEQQQSLDPRHWIRDWEEDPARMEALRQTWKNTILPGFIEEGEDGTFSGAAREITFLLRPSSLLSAALECQEFSWEDDELIRQAIILRHTNPPEYESFIEDTILPEFAYLARPGRIVNYLQMPGESFSTELWRAAAHKAGVLKSDEGDFGEGYFAKALWRGSGSVQMARAFEQRPLASVDSAWQDRRLLEERDPQGTPSLYQEAIARLSPEALRGEGAAEEVRRVQRTLLADQVMRIAYGVERDTWSGNAMQEIEKMWERGEAPLENLRPLFRGEDKEELLDDLLHRFRDNRNPRVHRLLQQELRQSISLPDISQQIYDTLLRIEQQL